MLRTEAVRWVIWKREWGGVNSYNCHLILINSILELARYLIFFFLLSFLLQSVYWHKCLLTLDQTIIWMLLSLSWPLVCTPMCVTIRKRERFHHWRANALIHKSSVNCPFSSQDMKYPSPFLFVFGEKVRKERFRKLLHLKSRLLY